MTKIIFVTMEIIAYCAFLIPSILEVIKNYRNLPPYFNEREEKTFHSIIEKCKKSGVNMKTRSIEIGS